MNRADDADQYNPYCTVCQSCGETGCCSSTICAHEEYDKWYKQ